MRERSAIQGLAISAAGVHVGGGMVLLRALLNAAKGKILDGAFDQRARDQDADLFFGVPGVFVKPRLWCRFVAAYKLASRVPQSCVLLCFNSLQPPIRSKARVIVYVHAPHIARVNLDARYDLRTWLRLRYEDCWFSLFERNADEYWVQTESMRRALVARLNLGASVRIVPFVDSDLTENKEKASFAASLVEGFEDSDSQGLGSSVFFYPADSVGHKNHKRLLLAWKELARDGQPPVLILTLTEEQVAVLLGPDITAADLNVRCFGPISRSAVLELLKNRVVLIFPSLAETFGLPLIEAKRAGATIVASERDFVWDVCEPAFTFDPLSPVSIARAVRRAQRLPSRGVPVFSALRFIEEVCQ